jgi:hypothetical protein
VLIATVEVGYIPGTLRRDLPRSDENRRDLSRRSHPARVAFALVRETLAQDPAYSQLAVDAPVLPSHALSSPGLPASTVWTAMMAITM